MIPTTQQLKKLKDKYPVGSVVKLLAMDEQLASLQVLMILAIPWSIGKPVVTSN